jgi:hypothetical protein
MMLQTSLNFLKKLFKSLIGLLARPIRDPFSGKIIGKAFLFAWGDKIYLFGAEGAFVPVPLPQKRLTYWKQSIGFTQAINPFTTSKTARDNSPLPRSHSTPPSKVLLVYLDHRSEPLVTGSIANWQRAGVPAENILLAYGGPEREFKIIPHANAVYISDPRLRTKDHQREKQSYRSIFKETTYWLHDRDFTHILFMEYDHFPLVSDVCQRYLDEMQKKGVDVLGYWVARIDGSTHPHWLAAVERTYPAELAMTMMGTGHFWKREVWEAVTHCEKYAQWYLELDLPTTAAHLGYRICGIEHQQRFINNSYSKLPYTIEEARRAGAWTIHPIK